MDNEVKKLYSALINKGYTTKNLGDEQTFISKMQDVDNRKQLYDWVNARGDFRIGSYEDYEKRLTAPPAPKAEDINPTSDKSAYTFTAEELGMDGYSFTDADKRKMNMQSGNQWSAPAIPQVNKDIAADKAKKASVDAARDTFANMPKEAQEKRLEALTGMPIDSVRSEYLKANPDAKKTNEGVFNWLTGGTPFYEDELTGENGELKALRDKRNMRRDEYGGYSANEIATGNAPTEVIEKAYQHDYAKGVDAFYEETNDKVYNAITGLRAEYDKEFSKTRDFMQRGLPRMINFRHDKEDFVVGEDAENVRAAEYFLNEAKKIKDAVQEDKNGFKTFRESVKTSLNQAGDGSVNAYLAIKRLSDKVDAGEKLTGDEELLEDALIAYTQVAELYSSDMSTGQRVGEGVGESLGFMVDIALMPGKGTAKGGAKLGMKTAGKALAKKLSSKAAKKMALYGAASAGRFAGAMAEGAIASATTSLDRVIAGTAEKMAGKPDIEYDELGAPQIVGFADQMSGLEAGTEAFVENTVEFGTEALGAEWIGVAGNRLLRASKRGRQLLKGFNHVMNNTKYGQAYRAFEKSTNYNGGVQEFIEEVETAILSPTQTLEEFMQPQNVAVTAISVAIPGTVMSTAATIAGLGTGAFKVGAAEKWKMQQGKYKADIEWMNNRTQWDKTKAVFDTGTVEEIEDELRRIHADESLTPEQKLSATEYAVYSLQYKTAMGVKNALTDTRQKMLGDMLFGRYSEGYEAADEQKGAVKQAYDMERERALSTFGEEVVQKLDDDPIGALTEMNEVDRVEAINYVNARTAYEGMIDRISDDIDERTKASDKEIESHKNRQDGAIHPAMMRGVNGGAPRKVYIVSGNVATFEDGTIDKANSSSMIIVRDAETGEVSAASADDLESLEAVIDTEAEKKTVAEQIANEYAGQQAAIIEAESGTVEGENGVQPEVAPVVEDQKGENAEKVVEQTQPVAQTALERVPKAENGEPVYEQADAETAWDAIMEQTNDEELATQVVEGMIADKEAALKKLENSKVREGVTVAEKIAAAQQRKAAIEKAKADLAKWQEIAGVKAKRAAAQAENVAQPTAETAPVVEETQAPVVESAPVEEVETPQATNEMQEADLENVEKGQKGQKAVEPVEETDSSTLSQTSDQVGDQVAEGGNAPGQSGVVDNNSANALQNGNNELNLQKENESYNESNQNDIPVGGQVSQSVSQGEHGEVASLSGGAQETAARLRERIESTQGDPKSRLREVENRVTREFAFENGLWIEDETKLGIPFPSGDEHNNYIDAENQVIYKVNNRMHTPSILGLLDRMELHNKYFPNTQYRLVGFTSVSENGDVMPVFAQDFVPDARMATVDEIDSYMGTLGFTRVGDGRYSNGEVVIKDLKPRNVLVNPNGDVFVVDAEFEQEKAQKGGDVKDVSEETTQAEDEVAAFDKQAEIAKEREQRAGVAPRPGHLAVAIGEGNEKAVEEWKAKFDSYLQKLNADDLPAIDATIKGMQGRKKDIRKMNKDGYKDNSNYKAYDYIETVLKKRAAELKKVSATEQPKQEKASQGERSKGKTKSESKPGKAVLYSIAEDTMLKDKGTEAFERATKVTMEAVERLKENGLDIEVVSQEEADAMDANRVSPLRTTDGKVYGWTVDGKIRLTPDGINPDTPVHEYAHLWGADVEKNNPKLWNKVVEAMKLSPVWNEVANDANYSDIHGNDSRMASEVLSRLSGRENYRRTMEQAEKEVANANGVFEMAERISSWAKVKDALKSFWNWVQRNVFHTEPMDWQDFVDDVVGRYYGVSKVQRLQEKIGSLARDVLNAVFKRSGIDVNLAEPVNVEQVAVVETESGEVEAENGSIPSVDTEENASQAASEPQARNRNMDREAWKKAFKKGGEKAYDLMYELHGGIVSAYPKEFLEYLKGKIGVADDVANVIEGAHDFLAFDFKIKNPELFKKRETKKVEDVHSLLATKGYSMLEHTMDNGRAIGVKMMYRDEFIPSGKTDASYTPGTIHHGRTVICYYNHPEINLRNQYVFTVTKDNAMETPTAYELVADPSLMTPEWAEYLGEIGRKNEDGTYNLEGLVPNFNDPFSLSHLMIRVNKTGSHDIETISRYNHGAFNKQGLYESIAGQPNATLDNNLDKLVDGLHESLMDYKQLEAMGTVPLGDKMIVANDGKIYRFNDIKGGMFIGDGFWVDQRNDAHVINPGKEKLVGEFLYGGGKVRNVSNGTEIEIHGLKFTENGVEFYTGGEEVTETREIEIKGEKRTVEKKVIKGDAKNVVTFKNGNAHLETESADSETIDGIGRLYDVYAMKGDNLTEAGRGFLENCFWVRKIDFPNLEKAGDECFNASLDYANLPNLREVGTNCFNRVSGHDVPSLPNLEKVGHNFMYSVGMMGEDVNIDFPKLREVGNFFMKNAQPSVVSLPSLETCGEGFMKGSMRGVNVDLPNLTKAGWEFFGGGFSILSLNAPKLTDVQNDFMEGNQEIRQQIMEQADAVKEEVRFRKMNEHAEEFNKTHKGGVPVVEIDPNNMEAELIEEELTVEDIQHVKERKENGVVAIYNSDKNIIYLLDPSLDKEAVYFICWHEDTHAAITAVALEPEMQEEFYSFARGKKKEDFENLLRKHGYEEEDFPEESLAYAVQAMATLDNWSAESLSKLYGSTVEGAQRQMEIIQPLIDYINNGRQGTQGFAGETRQDGSVYNNTANQEEATEAEGTGEAATGGLTEEEIAMLEASTGYTREEIIDMFGYDLNRQGNGPLTDREVVMESDVYSKVLGKPRYYGKRQREFVARQRRRMAEKARQVAEKLNLNNVEVLESTEGLTGKKATSKGWFDPRTGKITVVVPNHGSTGDIVETVLHEAVAHYGLRKLFGENFKNFLDNVYRNVTPEIRAEITELAKKHGWDFHTATEEYLASLAENTNFEKVNPSLWSNIKSFFMKMLAKVGITLDEPLGDNELRYILWRSHQNLVNPGWFNVFGQAEDIAKQYELGVGNYQGENGSLPSVAEATAPLGQGSSLAAEDDSALLHREGGAPGSAREEYERKVRRPNKSGSVGATENVAQRVQEAYQDSMLALKILQDAVAKETGNEVKDNENAYIAENRMSSSNKAMVEIYERDFFMPLMDEINALIKEGVEYDDIIRYLHAKHGLERNEYMRRKRAEEAARRELGEEPAMPNEGDADYEAKVNAKAAWRANLAELTESYVKKFAKRDYSGLTALTESANAKDAEAAAQQMVDEFENGHDTTPLWEAVNKATKETLRREFVGGLIDRATYDTVSTMFDFYIPLRGWDENVAANEYEYFTNNNTPVFTPAIKTMHGRKSLSDDPIATIGYMAGSAIARANRNQMKQKFLNFVMNNPTSLATVSEQWYTMDYGTNEWVPNNPAIPEEATPEQVVEIVEAHEANMRALEKAGKATRERSGLKIGLHATKQEQQQHVVRVMRNGKEYAVYINGNPRAAQALNGMTNPDVSKSKAREAAQNVKNFMARAFTSRNPAFIISNSVRDVIWAGTAVAAKEDAEYTKQYTKNVTGVLAKFKLPRLLRKFQNGTLDMNNEIERYFDEFLRNGGETGFTQVLTVEDYKRNIERFTKEAKNGTSIPKKAWRGLWDGIEFLNRSAEDITRFTVYMTSRQMGRSIERSVYDAKEITVNFNKKGSGEMGARYLNFAYIFFNATIQSLANFGKLMARHPGKMAAALGTYSMMGFLMPVINAALMALGDDDDEENYWNLPEWVRRNNIVLFVPWTEKGFITIPLPHEIRPFYGMGENAMSALQGKQTTWDAIKKSLVGFTGMLPIDFTANGGDAVVNLMPTILQPLAQVRANVTHFGTPIYKDNDFNKRYPSWTKAYKGTNSTLVAATKWLNELGGGNNVDSGGLLDWNPAVIEHLFESYLGGMGKTFNKAATTVSMIWDEEARIARNIPVASSFYQESDERTAGSQLNREYFDALEEMDEFAHRMSGYQKEITKGNAEYEKLFEDLVNSDEFMRYSIIKDYSNAISELGQVLKNNGPTEEEAQEIEGVIQELKKEMLDELEKLQAEE